MNALSNYIKGSIEEMKKVTWPTKEQATRYTILVIAISLVVAIFLGSIDYLFAEGLKLIIK
jgi:preprotein translocase subunit SecE